MEHTEGMEYEEEDSRQFNIELTYRTTVYARDQDEAIQLAREEMVNYPLGADVTECKEV